MNTYPEMNAKIVGLLRLSDNPECLYAAQRIEDLEDRINHAEDILKYFIKKGHFNKSLTVEYFEKWGGWGNESAA
jgi:hypothetical protein